MNNILKTRVNWVFILLLCILILPFLILFYFNNPSADDFCLAVLFQDKGFLGAQYNLYTTWFGRYFFTFVFGLNPISFHSIVGYKIFAFLLFLSFLSAIFIFIRLTFRKFLTLEWQILSSLGVVLVFVMGMPSLVEGLYWQSGSMTYQLGNIFTLLYLAFLFKLKSAQEKKSNIIYTVLAAISLFAGIGSNETSMIMIVVISLFWLVLSFILKFKNKKNYIVLFLFSIICFLIVYKAPGNAMRLAELKPVHANDLIYSITNSFSFAVQFIFSSINFYLIPFAALFIYIGWSNFHLNLKKTLIFFAIASVCSFALIWLSCFPNYWISGTQPIQRNLNITFLILVFLFASITILFGNLLKIFFQRYIKYSLPKYFYLSLSIVLFILLSGLLLSTIFINKTTHTAVTELVDGDITSYNTQLNQRYVYLRSQPNKEVNVKVLSIYPKSLTFSDLSTNSDDYTNTCTANFFNIKKIIRVEE